MAGLIAPPTTYPPQPGTGGTSTGYGASNSYIGNYSNLPPGITNAGNGQDSAYTRAVQPNELVGNQLNDLLASNSPYIKQARLSGMNTANDRGMLNSSIAAGNSQQAAINAGLPIAQGNASAYGTAAGQNLDALNSILNTGMNNRASMYNADSAAGASMYGSDTQRAINAANLSYQGSQAGLNRGFQDYMARQGFDQQQRRDAFQLGGNLLQSNDNFTHQMYLNQADNPFAMSNPDALQGYVDHGNANNSSYYDNLFGYSTNGGAAMPSWSESSSWYNTPSHSTGH